LPDGAYGIGLLLEEFSANGGRLYATRLYSLLNEEDGVFHCLAWNHSDSVLGEWRGRSSGKCHHVSGNVH